MAAKLRSNTAGIGLIGMRLISRWYGNIHGLTVDPGVFARCNRNSAGEVECGGMGIDSGASRS